jgi:hypothetical protein
VSVAEAPAPAGHNNPPEATPYEAVRVHIEDLWSEAVNWCDGQKIENQPQADAVAKLIEDFRLAHAAAEDARREENKPHDEAKAAVQAKYAPLTADTKAITGKTVKAMAALKATLTPWLLKLDAEKRAAEEAARQEAARKAEAAAEAMRAANPDNLAEREEAEIKVAEANIAQAAAARAANDKARARGDGRAIGLRTTYRPVMTDRKAAILHYMNAQPEAFIALAQQLAEADVRSGKRQLVGFDVVQDRAA